jgi:small-conductance mechanosensitive channel
MLAAERIIPTRSDHLRTRRLIRAGVHPAAPRLFPANHMIDHSLAPIVLATTSGGAAANSAASSSAKALEYLIIAGFDWGGRILGVVLIMFLAWVVATWARRSLYRFIQRARADATLASFAGNSVRWAILILGVVACLSIFGINIAAVTAVIGAAGLAVGLAMQGSLSNLAAGIMLLVLRPFRVGDGISVAGQTGELTISISSIRKSIRPTTDDSSFRTRRSSAPRSRTARIMRSDALT